jgi:hypothetical protein
VNELVAFATHGAQGGALAALVVFAVLAVWRGWLVPRRTIDRLEVSQRTVIEIQEKRLAEAVQREQEWRSAWQAESQARAILADHFGDVVDSLRTVESLVRALPTKGGDAR